MKYKIICCDLDDTLLDNDGNISEEIKKSVARFVDAGGKFTIVTGRMTAGARPVAAELDLHGELITYQGSVVTDIDTGIVLDSISIPWEQAAEIGRYLESRSVYYQTYEGDEFITEKANIYTVYYGRISHAEFRETKIKLSDYITETRLSPPKLLIMEPEEVVPALEEELKEKFGHMFRINTSKPFLIEIIPKEMNKAVAVERLGKKYNVKKEEIICIGDSENDLPMIQYAGLGVAVANASDLVKRYADVIAPSNQENGVAWTIDNYGFLK